jgi:hypothetical protein
MDTFFQTLARQASSSEFSITISENSLGSREEESVRGKKNTQ